MMNKAQKVLELACEFFNIGERDVKGDSRYRRVVIVREMLASYYRDTMKMSYPKVGRLLNKNSSSIIHHYKQFQDDCRDVEFGTKAIELFKYINEHLPKDETQKHCIA